MESVGRNKINRTTTSRQCGIFQVAVLTCIAFVLGRNTHGGGGGNGGLRSAPDESNNNSYPKLPLLSSNEGEALPVTFLYLPSSTKEIVINVGSNLDPIMPAYSMGPCAHSIAVEPIVGCKIMEHRQLSVINAAISDKPGVASMIKNNVQGVSSSLAQVAKEDFWNTNKEGGDGKRVIVPVITLTSLLNAIPSTVQVSFLKTDMQGFDFTAIRAAGPALKDKVTHIMNEVWLDDVYSYEVQNDLCRDWLPFMTGLGYVLTTVDGWGWEADTINTRCEKQLKDHPSRPTVEEKPGLVEANAFWIRHDAIGIAFPLLTEIQNFNQSYFSEEEYATCN